MLAVQTEQQQQQQQQQQEVVVINGDGGGGDADTVIETPSPVEKKLPRKFDVILITGKKENCEAASNALLVSGVYSHGVGVLLCVAGCVWSLLLRKLMCPIF